MRLPQLALFFAALLLFTGVPSFAEFYTDWLWYQELGYEQVFLKSLSAQATTGMLVGGVVFVILWLNLRVSLRQLRRREFAIATPDGPRIITVDTGRMRSVIYLAALAVAGLHRPLLRVVMGRRGSTRFKRAFRSASVDPVLGRDISFYLFRLPMLELVHGIALIDDHPDDCRRRRLARRRRQPRARSSARRHRQPRGARRHLCVSRGRAPAWCSRLARGSESRIS